MADACAASDLAQRERSILLLRDQRQGRIDQAAAQIAMVIGADVRGGFTRRHYTSV